MHARRPKDKVKLTLQPYSGSWTLASDMTETHRRNDGRSTRESSLGVERLPDRALQIVMHNPAQAEREIGNDVSGRYDLENRQLGDRRQGVRGQA